MRRMRPGARGSCKVKSGCQTCKTRRKKCDEKKPSCSQCVANGWTCDFGINLALQSLPNPTSSPRTLPNHMTASSPFESYLYTYFQKTCAVEFSLIYDDPVWETSILRTAYHEPSVYHAGLAISALSLTHYGPSKIKIWPSLWSAAASPFDFALKQYNLAIQQLNRRLDGSPRSAWLAVFCSIVFMNVEFLQGRFVWLLKHLRGGFALARDLEGAEKKYLNNALQQIQDMVVGFGLEGTDAEKEGGDVKGAQWYTAKL
ncbi:hypothetical protein P280DRAFT_262845 [Massarina eburnea CBS 473.64]|uniref:Zn(2)-C6 fungal-type domain-containing protein n=1 Tax=Massarina eburnea CBS 473.64 TaxID=1395130 RepID=A0A6A6S5E9_9PLEO|nr:hypothetical protein P280DRAFT_262845 [Massarina eburnea CBS 473.64]